jgi:hypothetical protein
MILIVVQNRIQSVVFPAPPRLQPIFLFLNIKSFCQVTDLVADLVPPTHTLLSARIHDSVKKLWAASRGRPQLQRAAAHH